MSSVVVFAVGVVVFALTVYGAVMATGLALDRSFSVQNARYRRRVVADSSGVPVGRTSR
jgi:hypothetical protein